MRLMAIVESIKYVTESMADLLEVTQRIYAANALRKAPNQLLVQKFII